MTPKDILQKAHDLISSGWTQHSYARTAAGYTVAACSPRATCWCLLGAIIAAGKGQPKDTYHQATSAIFHILPRINMPSWNDRPGRKQEEVLALLVSAMERLK